MKFADKVRERLIDLRWTQDDLAEQLGCRQQTVSRWLANDKPPKLPYLKKLAAALGLPIGYLGDDAIDAPPEARPAPDLEQRLMLIAFDELRVTGVSVGEAIDRLRTPVAPGRELPVQEPAPPPPTSPGRPGRRQNGT